MARQLLFLELNEVNFDCVAFYAQRGLLPNLNELIESNGWAKTTSESRHENLEPWIQWVTAHTGKNADEHGVFRLGDIINHDLPQIWEMLEEKGFKVGAICAMNARHRLRSPAFFVPDPWTRTRLTARPSLRALYGAIAQAVNDNAQSRVTLGSMLNLLIGLVTYARPANFRNYASLAVSARSRPWRKAILLDLLLADVFVREVARTRPDFATLFLNAAAHVQHHYMFSAESYTGPHRNPDWYIERGTDPVREVYEYYDGIVGAVRATFPQARLMVATGLHQVPHDGVTFYWRLRRHAEFLAKVGVTFVRVEPRMSRDFLIICASAEQARAAQERLQAALASDGTALFDVDNRGSDLFVMLTYARDIPAGFVFSIDGERIHGLEHDVVFVAVKNGQHNGDGYFLDSHINFHGQSQRFALAELPARVMDAFGIASGEAGQGGQTRCPAVGLA